MCQNEVSQLKENGGSITVDKFAKKKKQICEKYQCIYDVATSVPPYHVPSK